MTLMVKPDHAALYFLERLGKSKAPASSGANLIEKLGVFSAIPAKFGHGAARRKRAPALC
jgi:hypothetical protein